MKQEKPYMFDLSRKQNDKNMQEPTGFFFMHLID